ncbi:unnamed protein product [Effrenium voratum]|uniref:Cleavage stimulation factor 50 kDa subunit n=1 Tax=Effrenium voratum TaxID=2562239 RepID=A0AA36HS74_9DINO|nr:unnamed protein product [Effrenium voratum]CAJ1457221.1 unnamed protein product [Effrenium voratum]
MVEGTPALPNADAPMGVPEAGHFSAQKVALYELLLRQLQDDGFEAEVAALTSQLHLHPNNRVEKDALLDVYTTSLKWAFGDEPQGEWQPLHCTPVPPLGKEERVLDLEGMPIPTGTSQTPDPSKKPPEVRLLYTASHKSHCRSVSFSTDGRFCATGCTDGSIKILDTARMRVCAASTEGPVGRMRVTEEELMKPIVRVLQDHIQGVTCTAFHPTNPTLFSGSLDKSVKIFDLTRPPGHKKAFSVLQDVYAVHSICIHPCGDFLFVGTAHQAVRMYDLQTLSCFTTSHQEQHHNAGINDLRCCSDGKILATASMDGSIKFWDAVGNQVVNTLSKAHSGSSVTSVRWSRGQRYVLSSGNDGRTRLWDVRMGREVFCMGFGPRSADFSTASFLNGERYIAAANSNVRLSDVSFFDSTTGSPVFMKLGVHNVPVHALETSPVDKTIMTGCDDERARYFSIEER